MQTLNGRTLSLVPQSRAKLQSASEAVSPDVSYEGIELQNILEFYCCWQARTACSRGLLSGAGDRVSVARIVQLLHCKVYLG